VEPLQGVPPKGKEEAGHELAASLKLPLSTFQGGAAVTLESWVSSCPSAAWKPDLRSLLFADPGSRQIGMEEFRTLRTHLSQMREKLPLQTILVTSALPAEGKTFIAANLAQVFVQQRGKRALLIDGDLRLSRLHALLGTARSPGLSDFLRGKADVSEVIQRGVPDNLFFIPGGDPVSNPMELIGNGRLKGLLHRLAPLFDWIVIDSPPCVPLSDASVLADLCDGVLMVVLAGKTPFDMAQKAGQQFRDKRLLGVVLNHVAPQASYSAHYYHAPADNPAEHKD
ncbi:MAG: CpsD/CapB family tyrosine-protein kinase, partial [Terriglobia bacterium]